MKKTLVIIALAAGFVAANVKADFSGPYLNTPNPPGNVWPYTAASGVTTAPLGLWTVTRQSASANDIVTSLSGNTILLVATDNKSAVAVDRIMVQIVASLVPGQISYQFNYTGSKDVGEDYGYILNGIPTSLPSGSGFAIIPMVNGSTFGWWFQGGGNSSPGQLSISSLAPIEPEPSSIAMSVIAGLGAVGFAWRSRRAKRRQAGAN